MTDLVLRVRHFHRAGICVSGVRTECENLNVNFRDFLENGMKESEVQQYLPNAYIERALAEMILENYPVEEAGADE